MPTATFIANFSSFNDAVKSAKKVLVDFGDGADKVGDRLETLTTQFSGKKMIQEATLMAQAFEDIGGASQFTEKELKRLGAQATEAVEKMTKLGMEVPQNVQKIADETKGANKQTTDWLGTLNKMAGAVGIAFSVGAITNFIGSVFDAADAIKNQAAAVGMGAEAFQRISYAVEQGGGSMEDFTKAAGTLNEKLGTGATSTVEALKAAGLGFLNIRSMKPEEAFLSVADAIGKIQDPMEQARVAQELLGSSWRTLLPGMVGGYKDLAAGATVMSDETINSLAAAKQAWSDLGNWVVKVTGGIIADAMAQAKKDLQFQKELWGSVGAFLKGGVAGYQEFGATIEANHKKTEAAAAADKKAQAEKERLAKETANLTFRTQAQTEADKKAADKLEEHRKKIQELTDAISGAGLVKQVNDLQEAYKKLTPAQVQNLDTMLRLADNAKKLRDAGATLTPQLQNLVDQADALNHVLEDESEAVFLAYQAQVAYAFILGKTTEGVKALTDKEKERAAHLAAQVSQQGAQIIATDEYNAQLADQAYRLSVNNAEQQNDADKKAKAAAATAAYTATIHDLAGAFAQLAQIQGGGGGMGAFAGQVATAVGAMDAAAVSTKAMKDGFKSFNTGNTVAGMGQMAAGGLGLATSFLAATKGAGKLSSTMTGAAMGFSVAGPWGAAVGAGIGLIRGFFNAAKERKEVIGLRNDMVDAAGGMEAFNAKAAEAGISLDSFLSAKKKPEFEAAMATVKEAFATSDLRDNLVASAGGMEAFQKRAADAGVSLEKFFAANKDSDLQASITDITAAFDFQTAALELVTETAKKYGFTLEELGPALQKQELDKQAQELYKDWQVLNSAGIDTVAITKRMSEGVSHYVNDAMKMGQEVPEAMRPMLEAFVKSGNLLDENGKAVTDLDDSGIKFTMSMSEGFKKLIDSVKDLTDVISRSLGLAIKNVPDVKVKGKVEWDVPDVPTAKVSAPSSSTPAKGYARGTDGFENFGTGTPVVLHGWEAVVPREDAGAFATVGAGAGGGAWAPAAAAPTIIINAQGAFFDTPGDLQRLADRVNDALTAKFGLRTAMRAG